MAKPQKIRIETVTDTDKLIALGRVAANWAFFELQLNLRLAVLVRHDKAKGFPTNLRIEYKRRARLWKDLAKLLHTDPTHFARASKIIEASYKAKDNRDWAVHGFWGSEETIWKLDQTPTVSRMRRKTLSTKKLSSVADEIAELIWDFTEFYQRYTIQEATGGHLPYK